MVKSKLVIVHLARLEKTADLHGTLSFLNLGLLSSLLTVFNEQLCVVTGKLLELNQEVTQCKLEAVDVVGLREQVQDEFLNLGAEIGLVSCLDSKPETNLRSEIGESVDKQVANKVLQELFV